MEKPQINNHTSTLQKQIKNKEPKLWAYSFVGIS